MMKLLLIAFGGAAGSLMRYGWSIALAPITGRADFPVGTLVINLIGCLLIGFTNGVLLTRLPVLQAEYRALLIVGFLGGFTTFSAYGWETAELFRAGHLLRAGAYLLLSNAVGVALVFAGYALGTKT